MAKIMSMIAKIMIKLLMINSKVLDYTQFSLSLELSAKKPQRAIWEPQVGESPCFNENVKIPLLR